MSSFAAIFLIALITPIINRWSERRLWGKTTSNTSHLIASMESYYLYLALATFLLAAALTMFLDGGKATKLLGVLLLPASIGVCVFARGVKRLSLKIESSGFQYTGIIKNTVFIDWADIIEIDHDGSWLAIRTRNGIRHLISQNLIGVVHFVIALTENVPKQCISERALKLFTEIQDRRLG